MKTSRLRPAILFVTLIVGLGAFALQLGVLRAAPQAAAEQPPFPDQRDSVKAAAYWLIREFQNDDGGFSGTANQPESSIGATLDATLAIAAAGYNPGVPFLGEPSAPLSFLAANTAELADFAAFDGAQAGKVVLSLTASAVDPRNFGGEDYVAILTSHLEPDGSYGVNDAFKQSVAIMGVAAVREPVPTSAVDWLIALQAADGSWDDGFGTASNPDATALAIMALTAAGRPPEDPAIAAAVDFLAGAQIAGGWEYGPGFNPNPNTTAFVVQALSAVDDDWYSAAGPWVVDGQSALQALLAFQSTSGAFQSDFGQGPFDDYYATVQAIPAAAGRPLPLPARLEAARMALSCLDTMQDAASGGWPAFAGSPVDAAGTSRAIQSIVTLGEDPRSPRWTTAAGDAVEALEALTPDYLAAGRGGRVGIVMQGVAAAGPPHDVSDFAGFDLPLLTSGYLSPTGEYDATDFGIFAHSEAMLGLLATGEPVDPSAVELLLSLQSGGDWGDPDSNGIALQVLSQLSRGARPGTLAALTAAQTVDGGWGFGGVTSPSSSSEVVQGLAAMGFNPFGPEWSQVVDGRISNAADAVLALQGENGCWPNAFGPGDDPFSTNDAILLLSRQPDWGFRHANLPFIVGE